MLTNVSTCFSEHTSSSSQRHSAYSAITGVCGWVGVCVCVYTYTLCKYMYKNCMYVYILCVDMIKILFVCTFIRTNICIMCAYIYIDMYIYIIYICIYI